MRNSPALRISKFALSERTETALYPSERNIIFRQYIASNQILQPNRRLSCPIKLFIWMKNSELVNWDSGYPENWN